MILEKIFKVEIIRPEYYTYTIIPTNNVIFVCSQNFENHGLQF